jgi:glycosyltransferase 2 family protein
MTPRADRAVAPAKKRRLHRVLLGVALVATLVVPILFGGRHALAAAADLGIGGYAALLALMVASWSARGLKLHQLLHRLGSPASYVRAFGMSLATDLAFAATPAGVGGYVATLYYTRRAGASLGGATTIVAVDQGIDLVFFAISVPIAVLALADAGVPNVVVASALGVAALIIGGGFVLWLLRARIAAFLGAPNAWARRSPKIARAQRALLAFLASLGDHVALIAAGGARFVAWMLALTAVQWLARYAVLWLTLSLLGHAIAFSLAFLLQVVVLHAALWTGVPAGGGGAELGLTATLAHWVEPSDTASALIVWRAVTLYATLIAGSIAIIALARQSRLHAATPHHADALAETARRQHDSHASETD